MLELYPFVQHHLLKRLSLLHWNFFVHLLKLIGHICLGLFLGPPSVPLIFVFISPPVPHCHIYCSYVVSLNIRKNDFSLYYYFSADFRKRSFIVYREICWDFNMNCIFYICVCLCIYIYKYEYISLRRLEILVLWTLPIHEHSVSPSD